MKNVKAVIFVLFAFSLLVAPLIWGQGANPPASTKESQNTSGRGMTAVEHTGQSGGGAVEQEIKTLQAQVVQAILKVDTSFFEKYYADDYIAIHGNGTLSTKAQEIEHFKSGVTKYESIVGRESKIRIYGDTAVVNSLSSIRATFNGEPYIGDSRSTRVWVRQNGNWKAVLFQATRAVSASQ
jgi:ketosteroid isomerase-like protein